MFALPGDALSLLRLRKLASDDVTPLSSATNAIMIEPCMPHLHSDRSIRRNAHVYINIFISVFIYFINAAAEHVLLNKMHHMLWGTMI